MMTGSPFIGGYNVTLIDLPLVLFFVSVHFLYFSLTLFVL